MKKSKLMTVLIVLLVIGLLSTAFIVQSNKKQQQVQLQASTSLEQGISLFKEKKFAESIELLENIPNGMLNNWQLPYHLGSAQVMLKDYESAALSLEKALALAPEETKILFSLGVVYYKLGKVSLSKSYFASVLEIDPENKDARGLMEIMAKIERQIQEAAADSSNNSDAPTDGD